MRKKWRIYYLELNFQENRSKMVCFLRLTTFHDDMIKVAGDLLLHLNEYLCFAALCETIQRCQEESTENILGQVSQEKWEISCFWIWNWTIVGYIFNLYKLGEGSKAKLFWQWQINGLNLKTKEFKCAHCNNFKYVASFQTLPYNFPHLLSLRQNETKKILYVASKMISRTHSRILFLDRKVHDLFVFILRFCSRVRNLLLKKGGHTSSRKVLMGPLKFASSCYFFLLAREC